MLGWAIGNFPGAVLGTVAGAMIGIISEIHQHVKKGQARLEAHKKKLAEMYLAREEAINQQHEVLSRLQKRLEEIEASGGSVSLNSTDVKTLLSYINEASK